MSLICGFRSIRNVAQLSINTTGDINPNLSSDEMKTGTRLGSDPHADTSCVNKHAYVESIIEGLTVDAIPFDARIGKLIDLPIVNAIFAVDNETTFETKLIRLNHSIYIQDMEHSLLYPNQTRAFGTIVDDVSRTLTIPVIQPFQSLQRNLSFLFRHMVQQRISMSVAQLMRK